jgi:fatty-acyl-CoA synthase
VAGQPGEFSPTLSDLVIRVAARAPGSRLTFGPHSVGYADLPAQVARRAAELRGWGVRPGDMVAIYLPNSIDWVLDWFATAWLDANLVPINTRFSDAEVDYVIGHSEATRLIWGPASARDTAERLAGLAERHPGLAILLGEGAPASSGRSFTTRADLATADGDDDTPVSAETTDSAMVQYTSGSTAFPKGAVLGNASLIRNAVGLHRAWQATADDRFLVFNPLFHCGGSVFAFLSGYTAGASAVLLDRWRVADAFDTMTAERITVFPGIDASVRDLLAFARETGRTVPTLRLVSTAADGTLMRGVSEVLGCETSNVFGLTESSPNVCVGDLADSQETRLDYIGRAQPGLEVQIRDPQTRDSLPPGRVGIITVRGWSLMRGYLNDEAATKATIDEDGFLWTGDLGSLTEDGYLRFHGREKQMIKSGGENISIEEVELCLRDCPGITDAVVVPIPHARFGEVPFAFLMTSTGSDVTEDQVLAFCRQYLAGFKVPRHFRFVAELPRSGSGKVDRRSLAGDAAGLVAQQQARPEHP